MKNKFNLAILKQKDKTDFIEFNLAADLKNEIIGQRDKLINDIIYQDQTNLYLWNVSTTRRLKNIKQEI